MSVEHLKAIIGAVGDKVAGRLSKLNKGEKKNRNVALMNTKAAEDLVQMRLGLKKALGIAAVHNSNTVPFAFALGLDLKNGNTYFRGTPEEVRNRLNAVKTLTGAGFVNAFVDALSDTAVFNLHINRSLIPHMFAHLLATSGEWAANVSPSYMEDYVKWSTALEDKENPPSAADAKQLRANIANSTVGKFQASLEDFLIRMNDPSSITMSIARDIIADSEALSEFVSFTSFSVQGVASPTTAPSPAIPSALSPTPPLKRVVYARPFAGWLGIKRSYVVLPPLTDDNRGVTSPT